MILACGEWVIVASGMMSIIVMLGFFGAWASSKNIGWPSQYMLYYGLFLLTSNLPKLAYTLSGKEPHSLIYFVLDVLGLIWVYMAMECWRRREGFQAGFVGIAVWIGVIGAGVHHMGGSMLGHNIYSLSLLIVLAMTVYFIFQETTAWVGVVTGISFASWVGIGFLFPHAGDPAGHAFGMVTKVMVFGCLFLAHYERNMRYNRAATEIRRVALEIVANGNTLEDELARGDWARARGASKQMPANSGAGLD